MSNVKPGDWYISGFGEGIFITQWKSSKDYCLQGVKVLSPEAQKIINSEIICLNNPWRKNENS